MKEIALLTIILSLAVACSKKNYVKVSEFDPRYFELTNGDPYIAIGCNIAAVHNRDMAGKYITKLAENRANFARIWINSATFEVQTEYGKINGENLSNILYVLDLARKKGIKVKLCIESFRHIRPGTNKWDIKASYHISNGGPFENAEEFISSEKGRKEYLRRLHILRDAVGDHPAVFGWELWNEMNAVETFGIKDWNEYMLPEVKKIFPYHLVMQSLGSLDRNPSFPIYKFICSLPSNEVAQVHRYLDEGAQLQVCWAPMDSLCADAVNVLRSYGLQKPVLLAEGGAVRPNHTGPSMLYSSDTLGMLLHDVIFAPFFCGAAGTGHIWHWDHYVDKNDLWWHFGRFAEAVKEINPIKEHFESLRIDHGQLKVYALKGDHMSIAWIRDAHNTWKTEIVEKQKPEVITGKTLDCSRINGGKPIKRISFYNPWSDQWIAGTAQNKVRLPDFLRSLVIKIDITKYLKKTFKL